MNFQKLTEQYYSLCLGSPDILCDAEDNLLFYSDERNKTVLGYSTQFDIYGLFRNGNIIVSYGDKAKDKINFLMPDDISDVENFALAISRIYNKQISHHVKFCYQHRYQSNVKSVALKRSDYPAYLSFFKKSNPFCKNTDWVEEYFYDMTDCRLCCGVFDNGILVSCTDAPDMPYLSDKVQEIGINTLNEYRSKGYAADACNLCIQNIIESGKCPQWSCAYDNIASQKLAEKIGFEKFADVITVTL